MKGEVGGNTGDLYRYLCDNQHLSLDFPWLVKFSIPNHIYITDESS